MCGDSYFWTVATVIIPEFEASWKQRGWTAAEPPWNIAGFSDDQPPTVQEVNEALPIEEQHQPERDQGGHGSKDSQQVYPGRAESGGGSKSSSLANPSGRLWRSMAWGLGGAFFGATPASQGRFLAVL